MGGVITDSIADMLTRLRNANAARHDHVLIPASRMKMEIAKILKTEGFIADYQIVDRPPQSQLRLQLRYGPKRTQILTGIRRVSRPGLRIYRKRAEVPQVRGGLGVAILSTSRGIMTDKDARRLSVGGEVICYVW
uniref:Small ribosomal subunit protein uS8 n=1 Tax=uncultured bacterium Rifle_16ft_4_minimus_7469 TaxID=1665162 RepID=A0A0H4TCY8_9BACT|nr:30S ribosomal protein S8, small subunit ribosomal protein S8 [uncultured bacterium Rifle_16ft_4_minimus_7469]